MSVDSITAGGVFRIGTVMGRAWRLFTGNLLFFLLAPLVIYAAVGLVVFLMIAGLGAWAGGSALVIWLGGALAAIVALSVTMVGQGVLLLGAFQRLRGQSLRVGQVLHRVLARLGPLLRLSILWGLALVVALFFGGMIFSIFGSLIGRFAIAVAPAMYAPAAYILVVWAVVVPACLVEDRAAIDSIIRSADLTDGYRWKVFAIMFLLMLLAVIASVVQQMLPAFSQTAALIFAVTWLLVWISYWNCNIIMIYHDLRAAKEGVDRADRRDLRLSCAPLAPLLSRRRRRAAYGPSA